MILWCAALLATGAGIFYDLPNDMKLKRKAIRGVIKSKVPSRSVKPLSLNDCLDRQKN